VALGREAEVTSHSLKYLNRLSDAFFVFGRWAAHADGEAEPLWVPEAT